jgi:hypothetical protein
MRTWAKVTIGAVAIAVVGFAVFAGTSAYLVLRHLDKRTATEAETRKDFDAVRARFTGRPPLVEIVNPQAADIRLNRLTHPGGRRVDTLHVLTWNVDDGELLRTDAPLWLMKFSSINILSQLGIAPARFRLTVEDIERYGPGIVVDFSRPGKNHVLIWAE